jgi:hypothetical protein
MWIIGKFSVKHREAAIIAMYIINNNIMIVAIDDRRAVGNLKCMWAISGSL